ncbi:hypothetical protein CMI47_19365 [Candidatus Pacearchaeota archaeon]|nr:hypothetical protein [Candidatus Pacearchaeota archaeon]|tara:strand:+ start:229 stop:456 length:228 start_codon:yes stop_codon:yes gene_type:complete
MIIGDIVRQSGNMVKGVCTSRRLGVVIDITERDDSGPGLSGSEWAKKTFGRHVNVLWSDGKMMRVPERSLEVISE